MSHMHFCQSANEDCRAIVPCYLPDNRGSVCKAIRDHISCEECLAASPEITPLVTEPRVPTTITKPLDNGMNIVYLRDTTTKGY